MRVRLIRGRRSLVAVAGVAVLLAGCATTGGSPSPSPSAAPASESPVGETVEVTTATDATLGPILVGEGGKTLYLFTKDTGGTSVCSGDCAASWPPFVIAAGASVVGGEGVPGVLATITREDGALQVTYDGKPLYYFAADAKAGDVTGQGVNDVWFVVPPTGSSSGGGTDASATPGDDDYSRGGGASPAATP
ncbi:MAG TPA: hypothetical protein VIF84_06315 [Candidatus Limnocylindrales bacterium]|jgi:predicted lipoprotein with Yx(FWY)xxD motif